MPYPGLVLHTWGNQGKVSFSISAKISYPSWCAFSFYSIVCLFPSCLIRNGHIRTVSRPGPVSAPEWAWPAKPFSFGPSVLRSPHHAISPIHVYTLEALQLLLPLFIFVNLPNFSFKVLSFVKANGNVRVRLRILCCHVSMSGCGP